MAPSYAIGELDFNATVDQYHLLYYLYNTTRNNGTDQDVDLLRCIFVGTILSTIVVASFVGNLLVVLAIWTNRRLRTVTNCFVASLAMADLLVSLLVMPLHIVVELSGRWWFGFIVCDIWTSLDVLFCTASILNLCCISVDRYFAITRPLVYATRRSKKLALIMIAVVWVASTLITCPPIFGWQEDDRWEDDSNCALTKDPGYIIYSALGSFFVPMVIMLFVYAKIFRVTYEREVRLKPYRRSVMMGRRRNMQQMAEDISMSDIGTLDNNEDDESEDRFEDTILSDVQTEELRKQTTLVKAPRPLKCNGSQRTVTILAGSHSTNRTLSVNRNTKGSVYANFNGNDQGLLKGNSRSVKCDNRSEAKRLKAVLARERKAAKTLSIVVGAFVLCWLPFFLVYIIEPFCTTCQIPTLLIIIATWLGYLNSCCNPFIYAFSNRDFSRSFYNLTIGKLKNCRQKVQGDDSNTYM